MPTARAAGGAAVVEGRIHVVGGSLSDAANTPVHEAYDPATDTWQTLAPIPTARDHLAVVAMDGRTLALGGRVNGDPAFNLAVTEIYDPATDSWTEAAPMPTARSGVASAVLDDRVYVFGGETRRITFDTVEAYDPAADDWTSLAPMPTARHGFGAIAHEGRIHTITGAPTAGGDLSTIVEIFVPSAAEP